ncbi:hypothetical protein SAMN05444285_10529 [Draconibacterium orientale]|jgi:hypothetical protein|uniref:General stress protein CsbD n=1 Tax=Draconibacterium orientale TaxID=1168034 RepID=X5DZA4_9BACT|nr:hypothetical protein [Draconibacterium orientale]AHW60570.1 general stress protein CsbD [Draconibacterium orientale]MBN2637375.1 hypothetical protein [Prolixibacteraceae bacterium]SET03594.1 hypothetical protein SAMN05444285_10529 [Draconibacterium orientale]
MDAKFDMNGWRIIKDKLRNKYPELTEVDVNWGHISRDNMLEIISTKVGKTKLELVNEIESL